LCSQGAAAQNPTAGENNSISVALDHIDAQCAILSVHLRCDAGPTMDPINVTRLDQDATSEVPNSSCSRKGEHHGEAGGAADLQDEPTGNNEATAPDEIRTPESSA
jgi:hypothetical protein